MATTIRLSGGDLGRDVVMARCNLADAAAPIQVDYCEGNGWDSTQYQCADARHSTQGLVEIAQSLAASAVEWQPADDGAEFDCDWSALRAPESLDEIEAAVALETGADTSHQTAEDWYDSYGWHLSTEDAGDVTLQAVEYDWLDDEDDAAVVARLRAEDSRLTSEDAETIVAKARDIRGEADEITEALAAAVRAYERGDLKQCRESLAWAWRRESDHGDTPATQALASRLLLCE